MSQIRVISDIHYNHKYMAALRGFDSVDTMNESIMDIWNSTVNKKDVVWILGDVTMEKNNYNFLNSLKGLKKVVLGNHDMPQHAKHILNYSNAISGAVKLRGCILTHIPIHPVELRDFKYNIHGHVHENSLPDIRYINVSAEVLGYEPRLIDELIETRDNENNAN